MDCVIDEDGLTNVVKTVHWRLIGTDENEVSSDIYGAQSFPAPEAEGYIPFEQLTAQTLQDWVEISENRKKRNMAWLKANMIDKRLEDKVNPKEILIKPTWL